MTQVSEVEDLLDLVKRLAAFVPDADDQADAPTGCPCHCNFCGGAAGNWYGQEHEDDCPWVEAMLLLDPSFKIPEPGRSKPCEDPDCAAVDVRHTHADHDLMHQYAKAVEARVLFEEYERTGEHPRDPAFTKKDGTHPLCHVWLDGRQGYRESCAVEGCETLRDSYGHLCVNGEWNY